MFGLTTSTIKFILVSAVLLILSLYLLSSNITGYFMQEEKDNNKAVAVKAKENLKESVALNNENAIKIENLKKDLENRELLQEAINVLVADNIELSEKAVTTIKTIDNKKIVYIEEKADIGKSKIIIDEIWNVYNKGKQNEVITPSID